MAIRSVIVILLAIVCGLCAALGLNLTLNRSATGSPKPTETTPVLIVGQAAIPRGKLVTKDLVTIKNWPKDLVPAGALVKSEAALERAALQTMLPGEPIFDTKLAARGAVGGMASIIPSGKRAYTIQTKTAASNVAGFLLPGNLVDVLLTFRGNTNDETGGGSTTLLLQAVEVLAVGSTIEPVGKTEMVDAQDVESVTLLVTPEQVARLDLGQTLGMLSLSLRNPNDTGETETAMATIADIRFGPSKLLAAAASAPAPAPVIEPSPAPVPAEPEPKPQPPPAPQRETVAASILTLRGQSWGKVVVAPASHEEPVEPPPAQAQ